MSNVKVMPGAPVPGTDPVPEVVEQLRKRLAQAESGEIRAIATVAILENGNISTAWNSNGGFWTLVGAIDWLKHRMLSGEVE
jgi:hypothetical protein